MTVATLRTCSAKALCLLLVLVLLCGALSGCKPGGAPAGDGSGTAGGQESGTDAGTSGDTDPEDALLLFAPDAEPVTIWIAQSFYSDSAVKAELDIVLATVRKRTGTEPEVRSDRMAQAEDYDRPAILIGPTVFPESGQASCGVKSYDFSVQRVGNKVLLCAPEREGCVSAIRYFNNMVLTPQDKESETLVYSAGMDYRSAHEYPIDSVTVAGQELTGFRIVIPNGASNSERYLGDYLSYHLYEQYGYRLRVVTDTAKPAAAEIVVGQTNRGEQPTEDGRFSVRVQEGKLYLTATDARGYEALYDYIGSTLLKGGKGADYAFAEGYEESVPVPASLEDGTALVSERYGDVRVMFYNVFGGINEDAGPSSVRLPFQLDIFATYLPDVLGLQECSPPRYWGIGILDRLQELGYTEVPTSRGTDNFTPLFYRADRLSVVDSGHFIYANGDEADSKGVTWAVFADRETGNRFVVINTHFMYDLTVLNSNQEDRVKNAGEILELFAALETEYGDIPMIMGGDLNDTLDSPPLDLLEQGGLSDAFSTAEYKNDCSGKHPYPVYSAADQVFVTYYAPTEGHEAAIDHVFTNAAAHTRTLVYLTSPYALFTSDHMPVIYEFDF